nr:hypothetical protein [Pseudonocardia sp. HH130629-09]
MIGYLPHERHPSVDDMQTLRTTDEIDALIGTPPRPVVLKSTAVLDEGCREIFAAAPVVAVGTRAGTVLAGGWPGVVRAESDTLLSVPLDDVPAPGTGCRFGGHAVAPSGGEHHLAEHRALREGTESLRCRREGVAGPDGAAQVSAAGESRNPFPGGPQLGRAGRVETDRQPGGGAVVDLHDRLEVGAGRNPPAAPQRR